MAMTIVKCKKCGNKFILKKGQDHDSAIPCDKCGKANWEYSVKVKSRKVGRPISRIEKEAKDLFGDVRSPTEEENEAMRKCLDRISKPLGKNIKDF